MKWELWLIAARYKFMFEDGSSVTVLSQPRMDTLDVLEVQEP